MWPGFLKQIADALRASGAPTFGQKTAPTGTAGALATSTTFTVGLTLYPDSAVDVYVGTSSSVTSSTGAILRAGGAPIVLAGPVDPSTIYVLAASGSPVVSYVGQ